MPRSRQEVVAELGAAMQQYQRSVEAFDDAVGRTLGLGAADLRCLDWLTEGPRTAGELAVAAGLRPAATTALVDRLSARGLVRRVASPDDRRKVLVEMTEAGRELTWSAYGPLVEEGQHLFDDASTEQLAAMRDLLRDMRELTDRHRARMQALG
ncbi:MarR family winged helix-turn-helix transcriptional regulator [Microbacterium sp. NPDC091313]